MRGGLLCQVLLDAADAQGVLEARARQARPLWGKDDRAAADNVEVMYTPSVAGVGGVGSRL